MSLRQHVIALPYPISRGASLHGAARPLPLQPLGYRVMLTPAPGVVGMGRERPDFWIADTEEPTTAHVAFRADNRHLVDAFHEAALAAGGSDNGRPGPRPQYHQSYYGAFVLDPDD